MDRKLDQSDLATDPFLQFGKWHEEWLKATSDPTQVPMTLATVDSKGRPSARVVLLKSWDDRGFVFFTNYDSRKGREIAQNPHGILLFFWPEHSRQVRIEGTIERVSADESDAYFQSRDYESKLGAWASRQSRIIEGREVLEAALSDLREKHPTDVPRPAHWGGYRLRPTSVEFWQGRSHRIHDRLVFNRESGLWKIARLSP